MVKTRLRQKIFLILLGLGLSLLLIEVALRISGFLYLSIREQRNEISMKKGDYRIICLGESTTALGEENSWPIQLEQIMNQRVSDVRFSVINKGLAGGNSASIVSQLERNLNNYRPDMVIVMMGINDVQGGDFHYKNALARIKSFIKKLSVYKLMELVKKR